MRAIFVASLIVVATAAHAQNLNLTNSFGSVSPTGTIQFLGIPAGVATPAPGTPSIPDNDFVTVQRFVPGPNGITYAPGTATLSIGEILRGAAALSSQVSSSQLNDISQSVQAINSQVGGLSQSLVAISSQLSRMRREYDILSEGIALSSAMTILPPPEGRRLAITAGGAGYGSQGAGSISVSYRAAEDLVIFGAYARGATQNAFKGGASWSPW